MSALFFGKETVGCRKCLRTPFRQILSAFPLKIFPEIRPNYARVVAIALGAVSYYGIGEDGQMSAAQIKQGLDLSGGVDIVYEADQAAVTEEEMAAAISLLQGRLDWTPRLLR